jgi:hypothetical protein
MNTLSPYLLEIWKSSARWQIFRRSRYSINFPTFSDISLKQSVKTETDIPENDTLVEQLMEKKQS